MIKRLQDQLEFSTLQFDRIGNLINLHFSCDDHFPVYKTKSCKTCFSVRKRKNGIAIPSYLKNPYLQVGGLYF